MLHGHNSPITYNCCHCNVNPSLPNTTIIVIGIVVLVMGNVVLATGCGRTAVVSEQISLAKLLDIQVRKIVFRALQPFLCLTMIGAISSHRSNNQDYKTQVWWDHSMIPEPRNYNNHEEYLSSADLEHLPIRQAEHETKPTTCVLQSNTASEFYRNSGQYLATGLGTITQHYHIP